MCGIVGYIGKNDALEILISGLEKLEYRGYDSAGVAIFEDGEVNLIRAEGKLAELKKRIEERPKEKKADFGIGHTRWATHGRPSESNAHPHQAGRISLIHNGIVENYLELREQLQAKGYQFSSETDTEIAACLMSDLVESGLEPFAALKEACKQIKGSYAFVAIDSENPGKIFLAKNATPIVVGMTEDEVFIASDIPAILDRCRDVIILEDGDSAEVSIGKIQIENAGEPVDRPITKITWDPIRAQKGGYKHFMLKEINDQVEVSADAIRGRIGSNYSEVLLSDLGITNQELQELERIVLIACGTAWHACLVGKFYLEEFTGIPCEVDYASEFRYRANTLNKKTLVLAVSQSGETLDTLSAVVLAKESSPVIAICNVLGSSLTRKVDGVIYTQAGPEISVASTKAFTTQLISIYLFSIYLAQVRGQISEGEVSEKLSALTKLPSAIKTALKDEASIKETSKLIHNARDLLYIGRGISYPIALEGALKLKEISYIHAEGYPAGELKHGPIALIDDDVPVVVVLHKSDLLFEKTLSNLKEVQSRGGQIIAITDVEDLGVLNEVSQAVHQVPWINSDLSPMILTIPLQLLAYYVADFNGTDVDLPRNLAKSVTVE